MSWSTDETGSFYDNENFTMQWCILSESLRISVHEKGTHGYGGIWGGKKASFHHNLLAHHDSRNPRMCGSRYSNLPDQELVDFRNNVIYNWGGNSGYAGEGGSYNFVNNYYKPGAATSSGVADRIFSPNADGGTNSQPAGIWGIFYVNGNFMSGSTTVTNDNWLGIDPNPGTKSKDELKSSTEFNKGQITTHSATDAFTKVLDYAGASLNRDLHDTRVTTEAKNGTYTYLGSSTGSSKKGIIDTQTDVGGWPAYNSTTAPIDTDSDGIPDDWEDTQGLDKNDAADNKAYSLSGFYTNVEVYINGLVGDITEAQLNGGSTNYIDVETITEAATLKSENPVDTSQFVALGDSIIDITFSWVNAYSAQVNGLPEGITANLDLENKQVTISGAPQEEGVFNYEISTSGSSENASLSGTFTVELVLSKKFVSDEIKVYPNPLFDNTLTIETENAETIHRVLVWNQAGQLATKIEGYGRQKIETRLDIASGMYLIQIQTDLGLHQKKLLIK